MNYRHHGLISMFLFSVMVIIGIIAIAAHTWVMAGGYILLNLLSTAGVAYFYCAKCLCRENNCSHILIGKTADFLPKRIQGPYTISDYLGMMLSAGIVFIYPIYWLLPHTDLLIAFITFGAIGGIEIFFAVCTHCENHRCLACKWHKKIGNNKIKE